MLLTSNWVYSSVVGFEKPVTGFFILVGISAWKEFLFAFLFTTINAVTLPVFLSELMGAMFGISWGVLFAASFTQLLPVLIFLWIIQDFLLKGFAFGTEK